MTSPRRPLVLTEAERVRRLAERGRGPNLEQLHPPPYERTAMEPTPGSTTVTEVPSSLQPAAGAVLKQGLVQALTVVGVVAAAALAASEAGVLPAWVSPVAQGVIGLLAAAGIASPGIRKV